LTDLLGIGNPFPSRVKGALRRRWPSKALGKFSAHGRLPRVDWRVREVTGVKVPAQAALHTRETEHTVDFVVNAAPDSIPEHVVLLRAVRVLATIHAEPRVVAAGNLLFVCEP
jgi:hypothetical protein